MRWWQDPKLTFGPPGDPEFLAKIPDQVGFGPGPTDSNTPTRSLNPDADHQLLVYSDSNRQLVRGVLYCIALHRRPHD